MKELTFFNSNIKLEKICNDENIVQLVANFYFSLFK